MLKLKDLFLRLNLKYVEHRQILNIGIMIIISITINTITGSIALNFWSTQEIIEETTLTNGTKITYNKDGTTIFTYPDEEKVKGYPMAYPKEGPFYSRNGEFDNNATCEDADYHASPQNTQANTKSNTELNNAYNPTTKDSKPDDLVFLESIKDQPVDVQAQEINIRLFDKICEAMQKNKTVISTLDL